MPGIKQLLMCYCDLFPQDYHYSKCFWTIFWEFCAQGLKRIPLNHFNVNKISSLKMCRFLEAAKLFGVLSKVCLRSQGLDALALLIYCL